MFLVIATAAHELSGAISAARSLSSTLGGAVDGTVGLLAVANKETVQEMSKHSVDYLHWIDIKEKPAEAFTEAVTVAVTDLHPETVIVQRSFAAMSLAGSAAVALGGPVISGLVGARVENNIDPGSAQSIVYHVERQAAAGRLVEDLTISGPFVGIFTGSDVESQEIHAHTDITPIPATPIHQIERSFGASQTLMGGINNADRVVAVGRGIRQEEDLNMVRAFAQAINAELACSLPLSEDFDWLDRSLYVGRSGQHIAPKLYIAIGISGVPQHLDGVRDAHTIVAINSDPDAPIMEHARYAIVDDLYTVVPALTEELS